MSAARLNALVAVELDPVRRRERLLDLRLAAAVILAPRIEVCEALLAGVPVPVARLDPDWTRELAPLAGVQRLTNELALRVVGRGPLDPTRSSRAQSSRRARRWEGGGRRGGQ
jgi:hypothetical protein